jgi:molecular chaperone HscB
MSINPVETPARADAKRASTAQLNYFAIFDLPTTFALEQPMLSSRYRELQAAVHPDRFVNATDAEKRVAMARAVEINDAYSTLKDPVRRALHLLALVDIDGLDASDTSMPRDFLMEHVEWREGISDARLKEDSDRLEAMAEELASIMRSLGETFQAAFRGEHFSVATTLARKMRFMQKLAEEVDSTLADLDR